MGRYINWDDLVIRYPNIEKVDDATGINSSYIVYAENEIEGRLGTTFTTPFSSNNLTIKDLCIDLVYVKAGNLKIEESDRLREIINERIENLISGDEVMLTTSGEVATQVGDTVWSNTMDYHPVFGMGAIEDSVVDSSQIEAEENARL